MMNNTEREGKVLPTGKKVVTRSCTLPSIWRGLQLQRAQSALDPNQSLESHESLVQAQFPHKQKIEEVFDKYVETFPISPDQTLDFDPNNPESYDFITKDQITPSLDPDTLVREMDKILGKSAPWRTEVITAKVITKEMALQEDCKHIDHAKLIIDRDLSMEVVDSKPTTIQYSATDHNEMDLTNEIYISNSTITLSSDED